MYLLKNKNLVIYIYINKFNIIEENEFKKLVLSSGILINKFIRINIKIPNRKYFFGIGKLNEIYNIIKKEKFSQLLINIVFKSTQEYNLKKIFKCSILNRTNIILNIFKKRAITNYGKLQVKLAYLNYLSTRLIRKWSHLERQRGGIKNISGPGEKQIEIDRRIIKKKIKKIKVNLKKINYQKNNSRELRKKYNIPIISLVGYTNSGKSTLFNLLTKSKLESKNNYFSTLDTYIRRIKNFNFYCDILLSDTIGFIRNLPKSISNAFKSTLYEINKSQLILHIVDISNIYFNNYINIVNNILNNIIYNKNIPVILVMNKIDKIKGFNNKNKINYNNFYEKIWISAKKKIGINLIYKIINSYLLLNKNKYNICIPINFVYLIKKFLYYKKCIINEWSYNGYDYYIDILLTKNEFVYLLKKYSFINKYKKYN